MADDEGTTRGQPPPPDPFGTTQPIRPPQTSEPIPERVRQPIVVPRQESTLAGLPRPLAVAAVVALAIALVAGFLLGRSFGGGDETEGAAAGGRGCRKALTFSLELVELQRQALANRTEAAQAVVLGDEDQVRELGSALEALGPAIQEAEGRLAVESEKCLTGTGGRGKGGKDRRGANRGKGGPDNA
jgi:hypothetical protein